MLVWIPCEDSSVTRLVAGVCEFVKQSQIIEVLKSRFNKSFGERTAESPYVSWRMVAGFSLTIGSEL